MTDQEILKAPMTTEQILGADQLIALMRADLSLIVGTTDKEKLVALALQKVWRMIDAFAQLQRQHRLVSGPDFNSLISPLNILLASAQILELYPAYDKKRLVDAVAKQVPIMDANLEKIAQALREKRQ